MGGLAVPESLKINGFLSIFIIRAARLGTQAVPASLKVYGFPDIFMVWVERKAALATPESLKKWISINIYTYFFQCTFVICAMGRKSCVAPESQKIKISVNVEVLSWGVWSVEFGVVRINGYSPLVPKCPHNPRTTPAQPPLFAMFHAARYFEIFCPGLTPGHLLALPLAPVSADFGPHAPVLIPENLWISLIFIVRAGRGRSQKH